MLEKPTGAISTRDRLVADTALCLTAVLWGVNIPVVKFMSNSVDAFVFNALRMVVSTIVLGVLVWLESRWSKQLYPVTESTLTKLAFSFVPFALVTSLFYPLVFMSGIDRTTAGSTALIMSTMPLWTAVISAWFIRERLALHKWMAMMLAFIGTAIVILAGGKVSMSAEDLHGNFLILLASLLWAGGTVLSGPLLKETSPLRLAFFSSLLCTPMQLLIVRQKLVHALPSFAQWENLSALIYSGAFSTGIAYATWHVGVGRLGGSHAAVYQNVVTLVAVLGGCIVLGEPLWVSQVVGGIIMISGLLLMRRT